MTRHFSTPTAFLVSACLITGAVQAEQPAANVASPPPLMDLGELKLKVASTEAVEKITSFIPGFGRLTISPEDGKQLVVVTLTGVAPSPCTCSVSSREFSAFYEDPEWKAKGKKGVRHRVLTASAIRLVDDFGAWFIIPAGVRGAACDTWYFRETRPTPIKVQAAFSVPDKVETFSVRYPTLAKGLAKLKEVN